MKRLVIIGLDGVPYRLLKDLSENDIMPNSRSIMENGIFRKMESTIPEVSSAAWSSIITGRNPGQHGIFGFTDFPQGTYRLSFPNFNDLKATPFWKKDNSRRSVIINVPSTFPASKLNGIHISGFVALDLERSTYPLSLIPKLKELDYRVDVDASKAHESIDLFLRDLDKTLQARIEAYRYLWDKEDWNTFMLVFTGTDRLSHFLWDAYEDPAHKYHAAFLDHFRQVDEAVGEISRRLSENDSLIMLSDHGFELLNKHVNINYFLQEAGFLKLKDESRKNFSDIDFGSKAFALDPARIYINRKDKYPRGSVSLEETEGVINELIDLFDSLQINGRKVVKKIYRRDEIYRGPFINQAPDLVLQGNTSLNLKANIEAKRLWEKDIFTGKHTQPDAFLLVKGMFNKDKVPASACVTDIVNMIDRIRQS
jgi:predicted AlkP superfamily phosphohydrolase/phosphomutase